MTVGFDSSSSINVLDEMLVFVSLPLRHIYLIEVEALRVCHIAREEEASRVKKQRRAIASVRSRIDI